MAPKLEAFFRTFFEIVQIYSLDEDSFFIGIGLTLYKTQENLMFLFLGKPYLGRLFETEDFKISILAQVFLLRRRPLSFFITNGIVNTDKIFQKCNGALLKKLVVIKWTDGWLQQQGCLPSKSLVAGTDEQASTFQLLL